MSLIIKHVFVPNAVEGSNVPNKKKKNKKKLRGPIKELPISMPDLNA